MERVERMRRDDVDVDMDNAGGVVQMVSFGDVYLPDSLHRDEVWTNRGKLGMDITKTQTQSENRNRNRIHSRIVMLYIGPSLDAYESDLQLTNAVLDALKGTRSSVLSIRMRSSVFRTSSELCLTSLANCIPLGWHWLSTKGRLHRDISMRNILIRKTTAGHDKDNIGARGATVDLDHAVWRDRVRALGTETDERAVSKIHAVPLTTHSRHIGHPAIHGDGPTRQVHSSANSIRNDLESFFWVLFWIVSYRMGWSRKKMPGHSISS